MAFGSTATVDEGPKGFQAKQFKEKNRRIGNDALSAALSATYCKLLVLLGVCFPVTEVISEQVPTYVYQGFYVYLYVGSIVFIVFLYICALHKRPMHDALKDLDKKGNGGAHLKRKVTHFGSFYLRVGAIAFAIGTIVYSGLELGQFIELNGQPSCRDVFLALTPICRMALCIAQVQFIFLNTTFIDMARHKVTCRFGLMHMVATNLCEWFYVLVEETKHEIFHIGHVDGHNEDASDGSHNVLLNDTIISNISGRTAHDDTYGGSMRWNQTIAQHMTCSRTNIMGTLVQEVSPFLFPCTIEYSLICAVILYEMWKTVKSIPDIDRMRKHSVKPSTQRPAHHFSVDCSESHKGLFFGIIVIAVTIITMIMYFVLHTQPGYESIATKEVTVWEIIMHFMCSIAIIAGMIAMRDLKYVQFCAEQHHRMELDNLLLIVAQTGVYLYGLFSIMGSYFSRWDAQHDDIEHIVAEVLGLMQTSFQTMFILHTSNRRCKGAKQQRRKPGREIITFLLVANIAIWCINTFIKGRAVFRHSHLEFFGIWGWTIITHVSMPLAIFYRFHSTICLFEIWKTIYKAKAS